MTAEEYAKAGNLFDGIRTLPEHEWPAALDEACKGNVDLRVQVMRLLEADRRLSTDSFLASRAIEDAALLLRNVPDKLPGAGTVLGNYRLGDHIGTGGMGVVFEAEDLRLHRRVAVKVLPPHFAGEEGKELVLRFHREARAASLLNHPNIVSIYDAEFEQGWCYIAMEFIEGKTVRQLITSDKRPLDASEILDLISQVAAALSAAHHAGIVHRDIKPENIMVREDGFVKVLDFGLAKLREPGTGAATGSELLTRPGSLAGTIQYLCPERILGEPVGPPSDLFSLGVVAYELATGVRPFDGPTEGAVFDAILHRTPAPPSSIRPSLGNELDEVILRALEKDPDLRFQTASDLRSSCRRLNRDYTTKNLQGSGARNQPVSATPKENANSRLGFRIIAVAVLAAVVVILFVLMRPVPMPHVTRIVQITHDGLPKEYFVNDGTRVYYAAGNGTADIKMYEVSAEGGDPVPMPRLAGMVPLDISADGSALLLGQPSTEPGVHLALWVAATLGGDLRRVGDLRAVDARWSPNGDEILYCNAPELRMARSDGSDSRLVARIKSDDLLYPALSADGRSIRFTLIRKNVVGLWEVRIDGTHLHKLFEELGNYPREDGVWTHDYEYFVFSAQQTTHDLWAIRQSPPFSFRRSSNVLRLTNGPLIADRPHPSPDGGTIFFRGQLDRGELVRYARKANRWVPFLGGLPAMQIDYTKDRKWIAYAAYPDTSIWRCAADGSQRMQLTTGLLHAMNPRWSPDGTQIVFYGGPPGKPSRLYLVSAGGGVVRKLTHGEAGPAGDEDGSWSPDGSSLVFGPQHDDKLPNQPQYLPLDIIDLKTGRVSKLPRSEGLWSPRWSPDGRYIAALGSPEPALWLYNLETGERRQLTTAGASWPSWSPDSRYVQFSNNASAYRVRISDGKVESVASLNALRTADGSFGWIGQAPDGSLISTRDAGSTEIYALHWERP
jgi:eukaryotic-like serine/threonine-protein kinase